MRAGKTDVKGVYSRDVGYLQVRPNPLEWPSMGFQIPGYDKLREAFKERNSRMAKLREKGIPDAEIARQFKLTRARVGQILGPRNGS